MNEITFNMMLEDVASAALIGHAASADKARPVLGAVHFEVTGTTVTVTATDSYILASREFTIENAVPEVVEFCIPAKELLAYAKSLPTRDRSLMRSAAVAFAVEEEAATLSCFGITRRFVYPDGTFPRWRLLVPAEDQAEAISSVAFNAGHLANLVKTLGNDGKKHPVILRFHGEHKIITVTTTHPKTWQGLLMPVKL